MKCHICNIECISSSVVLWWSVSTKTEGDVEYKYCFKCVKNMAISWLQTDAGVKESIQKQYGTESISH